MWRTGEIADEAGAKRRFRTNFSDAQSAVLEAHFQETHYPDQAAKRQLARSLDIAEDRITVISYSLFLSTPQLLSFSHACSLCITGLVSKSPREVATKGKQAETQDQQQARRRRLPPLAGRLASFHARLPCRRLVGWSIFPLFFT